MMLSFREVEAAMQPSKMAKLGFQSLCETDAFVRGILRLRSVRSR
jgi:hypothetical protein